MARHAYNGELVYNICTYESRTIWGNCVGAVIMNNE